MTATTIAARARLSHIRRFSGFGVALTGEGGHRRFVRARAQPQFLARSRPRLRAVAPAAGASGHCPCDGLSRPQRQWRPRPCRAVREGRADHHRQQAGGEAHRCLRLGHPRRPHALLAGRGRRRRDQPLGSDAGPQESRCRWWCRGLASPADIQIGLVGGGDIEGTIVKSGGIGFEGLDLELVDSSRQGGRHRAQRFRRLLPVRARRLRPYTHAGISALRRRPPRSPPISASRSRSPPTSRSSGSARFRPGRAGRIASAGRGRAPSERLGRAALAANRMVHRLSWCGREDSNFHGLSATATSTLRVYQFRHDRTS